MDAAGKVPTPDGCRGFDPLLEAHADGQLDATRTLELEAHLESCAGCRERVAFQLAVKGSLRRTARTAAPDDVRARILARLTTVEAEAEERAAAAAHAPGPVLAPVPAVATDDVALPSLEDAPLEPASAPRRWSRQARTAVPFAAAAGVFALWSMASHDASHGITTTTRSADMALAGFGDEIMRDLVAEHSHPLPPERTDPREVRALERYVGVPVRVVRLPKANARFVGGRILAVHRERAAMLQYELGDGERAQRVSVFVYDPRRVQVRSAALVPRAMGTSEVSVGQTDGYSVAVTQRRGVGYAVASDMDVDTSAQLALFDEE